MWKFKLPNERDFTLVEILALASVSPNNLTSASSIIKSLNIEMGKHWSASRGTVYPILNRLEKHGFVSRNSKKQIYLRTDYGSSILIKSMSELINQFRLQMLYTNFLTNQYVKLDTEETIEFLGKLKQEVSNFIIELDNNLEIATKINDDEDWNNIEVE